MQQIVDLQNNPGFQTLDVRLISIAFDSQSEQMVGKEEYGINIPMLIDEDHEVSRIYNVLQWATRSGEPGHTFILVDADGKIAWIQDYGAAENRGVMYVPVEELTSEIERHLEKD